jgi:CBS domain containing-hemolysin-like protein
MALETPIIFIFTLLPRLILKLIGGAGALVTPSITEGELRMLIDIASAEGSVEMGEAEMLASVFRFGDRQVREMMTPRTEIVFVERGTQMGEFLNVYAENAHTRFPVYKGSTDDVIGILSAKDILRAMSASKMGSDDPVTTIIRDAYFVPETKRIAELFDELRGSGNQIAIAIDEFGGIAGLVTLKRLLEEVVGRVGEEGVSPAEKYEALGENTFQLEGGMNVDQVKDEIGIDLGDGNFETVAGFVLETLGHIPTTGETFEHDDLSVEVVEMERLKIEAVKLTRRPARAV